MNDLKLGQPWDTIDPFGKYVLEGATLGMEFGLSGGSDLRLINDFDWLRQQFDIAYPQETAVEKEMNSQEITDLLDRFEYMYDGISDMRRLYNDKDSSLEHNPYSQHDYFLEVQTNLNYYEIIDTHFGEC